MFLMNHDTRILIRILERLTDMALNIAQLQTDVTAQTTVIQSAVTLIKGLNASITDIKAQLASAIAANDPAAVLEVQKQIDYLDATLASNTVALASAVPQNTVASGLTAGSSGGSA